MSRRNAIKFGVGAAAAFGIVRCSTPINPKKGLAPGEWSNWSGGQRSRPALQLSPPDLDELQRVVRSTSSKIRVVGGGHSFSPVVRTDDTLLSIDQLSGIIEHNPETLEVTVWAGTNLFDLGEPLWDLGLSLPNQGDIDYQSVAGAVSTSTHGTGVSLGSFSSMVTGFELLTASGELLWADKEQNSDVFYAGCTSIGALGIFTKIRLQCVPAYHLHEVVYAAPLADVLANIDTLKAATRHFEFFPFLFSDKVVVKTLQPTEDPAVVELPFAMPVDHIMTAAAKVSGWMPATNGPIQDLLMLGQTREERQDRAYRIFPSPRTARFNEMEYEVPADKGPECVAEIKAAVQNSGIPVLFPLEYRYIAKDECWLSPFYQRDSVAISVHRTHWEGYEPLFKLVEPILQKYGGRPHWGKLQSQTAATLQASYPKWNDFLAVRAALDPKQRFINPYLKGVFGL